MEKTIWFEFCLLQNIHEVTDTYWWTVPWFLWYPVWDSNYQTITTQPEIVAIPRQLDKCVLDQIWQEMTKTSFGEKSFKSNSKPVWVNYCWKRLFSWITMQFYFLLGFTWDNPCFALSCLPYSLYDQTSDVTRNKFLAEIPETKVHHSLPSWTSLPRYPMSCTLHAW